MSENCKQVRQIEGMPTARVRRCGINSLMKSLSGFEDYPLTEVRLEATSTSLCFKNESQNKLTHGCELGNNWW
jgi:hypothetical protein